MRLAYKTILSLIVLVVLFYAIYLIINFEAISKIAKQNRSSISTQDQTNEQIARQAVSLPTPTAVFTITARTKVTATATPRVTSTPNPVGVQAASAFKNDWLYYPKLSISAPVEWYVQGAGDANKLMANGLVHIKGTATPEIPGETVIAGHSSYYSWAEGDYKTVFAPLVKAQNGDNIIVKRNGTTYFYNVSDIHEISGSDDYAAKIGGNNNKSITLMTCVPVGTTLRRLIISADLVRRV